MDREGGTMKERECREEREMEGCGVKGIIIFICAYHILLINCTLSLGVCFLIVP